MSESKKESIGALWLKTSQKGTRFMSGVIEIDGVKTQCVIFKNTFKTDSEDDQKKPDYRIFKSEPRADQPRVSKSVPADNPFSDSDIPF